LRGLEGRKKAGGARLDSTSRFVVLRSCGLFGPFLTFFDLVQGKKFFVKSLMTLPDAVEGRQLLSRAGREWAKERWVKDGMAVEGYSECAAAAIQRG
jgi:hypothetical protein